MLHVHVVSGDYMREDNPVYEDIEKLPELKKFMEEKLEDYNMEPGIIGMDLVLFKDAIDHGEQRVQNSCTCRYCTCTEFFMLVMKGFIGTLAEAIPTSLIQIHSLKGSINTIVTLVYTMYIL